MLYINCLRKLTSLSWYFLLLALCCFGVLRADDLEVPEGRYISVGSCKAGNYPGGIMPYIGFTKVESGHEKDKCPDAKPCINGQIVQYDIHSYDVVGSPGPGENLAQGCACIINDGNKDPKDAMTYFSIHDLSASQSSGSYHIANISSGEYNPKYNLIKISTPPWDNVRLKAYDDKTKKAAPDPEVRIYPGRRGLIPIRLLAFIATVHADPDSYCNNYGFKLQEVDRHGKAGIAFPGDVLTLYGSSGHHCAGITVGNKTSGNTVAIGDSILVYGYQFSPRCRVQH